MAEGWRVRQDTAIEPRRRGRRGSGRRQGAKCCQEGVRQKLSGARGIGIDEEDGEGLGVKAMTGLPGGKGRRQRLCGYRERVSREGEAHVCVRGRETQRAVGMSREEGDEVVGVVSRQEDDSTTGRWWGGGVEGLNQLKEMVREPNVACRRVTALLFKGQG